MSRHRITSAETHAEPSAAAAALVAKRSGDTEALTLAEVAALPATVDLMSAARALGIGRTTAYTLARTGQFPCRLVRAGGTYRVPTAGLLQTLGLDLPTTSGSAKPATPGLRRAAG